MGYHGIRLLHLTVELDGITMIFVASGAGLFVFVWPLRGVLLGVFLD